MMFVLVCKQILSVKALMLKSNVKVATTRLANKGDLLINN